MQSILLQAARSRPEMHSTEMLLHFQRAFGMFSHVGGDCRDWGREGKGHLNVGSASLPSFVCSSVVCMDRHVSYMNYIRYNYITSFTEDPNLGKSSQAPQFLFESFSTEPSLQDQE